VSVQWGAWAGAGMAASDPQTAARVARLGMGLISPQQGLAALEGALCASSTLRAQPTIAAVPIKWSTLLRRFSGDSSVPSLFSEFASMQQGRSAAPARRVGASGTGELTGIDLLSML